MHARLSRRRLLGFTLLELIVGLVVIGVLAALAVPTLSAVRGRSALEVEEAGLAAIARAAYAHARLGDPSATSYTAADLEAVTAPDAQAAESLQLRRPGRQLLTALGEFSTATQVIHASIRPDGTVGLAVYVPQAAACAYAHAAAPSRGLAVETWSVKGAAVFECAGNVAAGGPSGTRAGMLLAPPTPTGLRIVDGLASWDADAAVAVWDVWCAGGHLGETTTTSFDVGTCDDGDVLVSARASGSSVPGWEGGPSTVDPAPREIGGGSGSAVPSDTATASSSGAISVTWDTSAGADTDPYTLDRSVDGGATWTTVATGVTGGAYVDRTAPTDGTAVTYRATGPSGPVATTAYTPSAPAATPATPTTVSSTTVSDDGWLGVDMIGRDAYVGWLAVDDTPQAPLDGYRLYRAASADADWTVATRVYDGTALSYADLALTDGTWCWRVSAYGPGGESAMSAPACTTAAPPAQVSFAYTGAAQTFTVPDGVTKIRVDAYGGQGGPGEGRYDTSPIAAGGRGGHTAAVLAVTPGETLHIYVGGKGAGTGLKFTGAKTPVPGGWNGGGDGAGGGTYGEHVRGGGGGGASDVRIGGTTLDHRAVVAAGGGGAGACCGTYGKAPGAGGAGGGLSGVAGAVGQHSSSTSAGGNPGTQTAGGSAGFAGGSGVFGAGGDGKPEGSSNTWFTGGGGGGGWYGAAASVTNLNKASGGGGGGSSYATPDAISATLTSGARSGAGQVDLSY